MPSNEPRSFLGKLCILLSRRAEFAMPRFVILKHSPGSSGPRKLHWDLMLERAGVLQTWALATLPGESIEPISAIQLPDHRLEYLEYQGPVSGHRGTVKHVERGEYEVLDDSPSTLKIKLAGQSLNVVATLRASATEPNQWWFERAAD